MMQDWIYIIGTVIIFFIYACVVACRLQKWRNRLKKNTYLNVSVNIIDLFIKLVEIMPLIPIVLITLYYSEVPILYQLILSIVYILLCELLFYKINLEF